jgi:predicted Zn-dependent peptidase
MEQGGVFLQHLLASGVQVVGQPMAGVESAAVGILVGTGARDEQPERFGVSHFTEQMLFRGTEHLDARALSDRMDALGISYDSSTGLEMTLVSALLLGRHVPAAIDLLTDVVHYPSFPEEDVENVRALIVQEQRQREDRPAQKVMEMLRGEFFRGSTSSHDVLGTEDTITALGRQDLVDYWRARYTANNMLISIAGNFDWDALIPQLERVTASWPRGDGRAVAEEPQPRGGTLVIEREAAQENLGFAFPGVSITDPHYYALALAIQALGGSSTSRLFQEVREKRGLAYAVQARFDGLEKTGIVRVYCGTSADRAHESVEVILEELRKLERKGITEDELARSKTRLKAQIIMRSESTSARMVSNLRSWWFEGQLRSLQEIKDRIDHVTVEEISTVLEALNLTDHLAAVAIGPRSETELFGGVPVAL